MVRKFTPLTNLIPNIVTIASVCAGLTAIRYSFANRWDVAVILVIIAAFLDLFDGKIARMMKSTSDFGAQLDSLADFVNYGVVPPIIIYLWTLKYIPIKGIGWGFVLFFSICCIVRLARFNVEHDAPDTQSDLFFTGLPSTAGGVLALLPIVASLEYDLAWQEMSFYIGIYMSIIAILMPSRVPSFCTKAVSIPSNWTWLFLVLAGTFIGAMIIEPWNTILATGIGYILSIPISCIVFLNKRIK